MDIDMRAEAVKFNSDYKSQWSHSPLCSHA